MIPNTQSQWTTRPSYKVKKPPQSTQSHSWTVNSKQTDLTEMLQSSLTNMNLTNPVPTKLTNPPANHANGPPVSTQYQQPPTQQGVYLPLPAWLQGKGSIPPLYQQVTTQCADPRQSYYLLTHQIQPVLLSSGLDKVQLKSIWDLCCRTAPGVLTLTECYTVLGLIALVQQGHEIGIDKLASLSFVPIPRIDTTILYQHPVNQLPNTHTQQPAATNSANAPTQLHSGIEARSANNDTSFGEFQSAGSEFGTFQSAVQPAPVNNSKQKTEESVQVQTNSPILSRKSPTDTSDKYSCFREVADADTFSPIERDNHTAVLGSDDKYAFLRALDSEQAPSIPTMPLTSALHQPTQSADTQVFPTLKSADTPAVVTNNTMPEFSLQSVKPDPALILSSAQIPVSNKGTPETTLMPEMNVVKSDFCDLSDFSAFQSADAERSVPSKEPVSSATDWGAFTSTTLQNDNKVTTPADDKYSIFPQLQSAVQTDPVIPTANTSEMQMTTQTETDWSAFTSTAAQDNSHVTTLPNDKYSVFSQLQTADKNGSVPPADSNETQTTTNTEWSGFTSNVMQNNNNVTTLENDRYSVFSQLQSAEQDATPQPPLPIACNSNITQELSLDPVSQEVVTQQKLPDSKEQLSNSSRLDEFRDFSVFQSADTPLPTSELSQQIFTNKNNNGEDTNTVHDTLPPGIVDTAPVSSSEKQETTKSAVSTNDTIHSTLEESKLNPPPPLDDVPNDSTNDEDFNFSGFNSYLTSNSSHLPESKSDQQGNIPTETGPQSIASVLQSAALEEISYANYEDTDVQDTPLAAPSSHFPDTPPTHMPPLDVSEPDMSGEMGEKTPLADRTLTSQGVAESEKEIEFSVFTQFQSLPKTEELDCYISDTSSQSKGENDLTLSSNNYFSQGLDFSEFSSFPKPSDSSVPGETLEESDQSLKPDLDPFQDLSSLQTSELMKGQPPNIQPKWTLFDTLATALQDLNSVPIDNYKNQKFQIRKAPVSEIQQEEAFSRRRSPLPPDSDVTQKKLVTRAPSYKLSEDGSSEVRDTWYNTLSASSRVVHFCFEKVQSATSVQILKELVAHETSYQYFQAVFEVMKIVSRIKKHLPANWEDCNTLFDKVTGDWANIKSYLNHGELEFSDIVVSTESEPDEPPCHCGVCLDVILKGDIKIEFGGFNYHNTCANFWLNEVGSILPRLSMESHGLSI